jgi:hypothetical protein
MSVDYHLNHGSEEGAGEEGGTGGQEGVGECSADTQSSAGDFGNG